KGTDDEEIVSLVSPSPSLSSKPRAIAGHQKHEAGNGSAGSKSKAPTATWPMRARTEANEPSLGAAAQDSAVSQVLAERLRAPPKRGIATGWVGSC
ncbi:MAG: hypothetical protein ACREQY_08835, partial [Candidatus Binatia bacterium]